MAKYNCEICRGSGRVRLPIFREARAVRASETTKLEEACRTFPCPECSETVALDRVAVVAIQSAVDSRIDDPDALQHISRREGIAIGAEMMKQGLIAVRVGEIDDRGMSRPIRATAGVVSQAVVASMEERIAARQEEVAREVVALAAARIENYGSHYGHTGVAKSVARAALGDALKIVLERRKTEAKDAEVA